MSPHDHKALALRGSVQEVGKALEASTKNATLHEVLIRQEMLSNFLQISPEVLSQSIPHVHRIILRSCRHGVNMSNHLQDVRVSGLVNELHTVRCTEDLMQILCHLSCPLERD